MRKVLVATLLMGLVPPDPVAAGERFSCNMSALTKSERARYAKLTGALLEAAQETSELKNGYAFRFPPATLMTVSEWVGFERKCCPFFTFELEVARDNGPVTLRITGSEGVKAFIRAEFQLDS